jgi:hypothetical protein
MIRNYVNHLSFIAEFMKEGIKEKKLKPEEPQAMAAALMGIIRSFIFNWMLSERNGSLSSKTDQVVNIFFNGVIIK